PGRLLLRAATRTLRAGRCGGVCGIPVQGIRSIESNLTKLNRTLWVILVEHDLIRKPLSTFRDHAPSLRGVPMAIAATSDVQIDNDEVRVTEWRLAPGSATGHHRHEMDYVIVPVTNSDM